MQAIVCREHGPPSVMRIEEVAEPTAGSRQVVIRSEAIGVNFVDTMRRSGRHPAAPAAPFSPGIEVVGRVASVGSDVSRFKPGDRVIGRCVTHGAYAELVPVEERFTVDCPESISAAEAAGLFVTGQTAIHALQTVGRLQPGESVLITAAAGGVGLCAVQIAKALDGRVVGLAGSDAKLQAIRDAGADIAIDYSQSDWVQQVLDATGQKGCDLILESVGGELAAGCLDCWAFGGRMVVFGKASGIPMTVSTNELLFGNRSVFGLAVGTVIEDEVLMRCAMERLFEWYHGGELKIRVAEEMPLSDAAKAHELLVSRKTIGKIVLLP
ncbi:MAG: quinone oxidoreductase family protein [Planctomycetota bacterium]|jgi:NADPH2:quinone reductase